MSIATLASSNGVGNLAKQISYATAHGVAGLWLIPGTPPFPSSASQ